MIQPRFKTSMTGVPIIRDLAIETDAERLLRDYNPALLDTPQAINVEDFTENYLGLRIHFDNLSHNGSIWGRMVFYNSRIPVYAPEQEKAVFLSMEGGTVLIDNSLVNGWRDREFRSTMMHECGHKVYHSQYYRRESPPSLWLSSSDLEQIPATACRKVDVQSSGKGGQRLLISDHDWLEHQAKYFSSAILMPTSMVMRVYEETDVRKNMGCYEGRGIEQDFELALMNIFRVSAQSARIRIRQLGLDFATFKAKHPGLFAPKMHDFYMPDLSEWAE